MILEGQVALITGSGQGIGRTIALTLASEGAAVVVNDLLLERAESVATEIAQQGGRALAIAANIAICVCRRWNAKTALSAAVRPSAKVTLPTTRLVTVAIANLPAPALELVLSRCTEAGAHAFVVFQAHRSVGRGAKLDRWTTICS